MASKENGVVALEGELSARLAHDQPDAARLFSALQREPTAGGASEALGALDAAMAIRLDKNPHHSSDVGSALTKSIPSRYVAGLLLSSLRRDWSCFKYHNNEVIHPDDDPVWSQDAGTELLGQEAEFGGVKNAKKEKSTRRALRSERRQRSRAR